MKFGAFVGSILLVLGGQSMAATVYVDAVVPGLTATDHSGDDEVFARGYYQIGDGGGGWFSKSTPQCQMVKSAMYNSSSATIAVDTTNILVGMGVSDTNIPTGDYVVSVSGSTITLHQAPSGSGSQITLSGGNGGTLIGDYAHTGYAGHCFNRAGTTNWSVREWGAKCDVTAIFDTGSYNSTSHKFHWGSAQALTSADIGKTIVIPGLGAGPYYPVKTVIANMGGSYSAGNRCSGPVSR